MAGLEVEFSRQQAMLSIRERRSPKPDVTICIVEYVTDTGMQYIEDE